MQKRMFFKRSEVPSNAIRINNIFTFLNIHFPDNNITSWGFYKEDENARKDFVESNKQMWDDYFCDKKEHRFVYAEEMKERFGVFPTELEIYAYMR